MLAKIEYEDSSFFMPKTILIKTKQRLIFSFIILHFKQLNSLSEYLNCQNYRLSKVCFVFLRSIDL